MLLAANMNLKWLCPEIFVDVSAATQFNDIGPHGTKIIVFNLSHDAKGDLDLDFNTDTMVTTTYRLKSVGIGILYCHYCINTSFTVNRLYFSVKL